jgi:Na+/melibiose symporter-like transporter
MFPNFRSLETKLFPLLFRFSAKHSFFWVLLLKKIFRMLKIQQRLAPSFYALLSLPSTAMGFALSVQISALSWILSTKYGLAIHEIGLVWAAGPIAGIFGQVIIGLISDNVWFWGGRRRPFIVVGGTLAA